MQYRGNTKYCTAADMYQTYVPTNEALQTRKHVKVVHCLGFLQCPHLQVEALLVLCFSEADSSCGMPADSDVTAHIGMGLVCR